jgi:putative chitinase
MIPVDGQFILSIAPRFSGANAQAQKRIVGEISGVFASTLNSYDINTRLRIAHFMGQVTHECAGFRTTEEFASGAAYEGRKDLGNTQRGDGKRFKGRGLLQLTGRANYKEFGDLLCLPLEEEPVLAGDPVISLQIACLYWQRRNINPLADEDNLYAVTRKVNGGTNGIDDRQKYLQKAKIALANIEGLRIANDEGGATVVLRRGSFGEDVSKLQALLRKQGFALSIDGDFGAATESAVVTFQNQNRLSNDGVVGKNTWKMLKR